MTPPRIAAYNPLNAKPQAFNGAVFFDSLKGVS
jgi:hypothetical protein